jgi:C_GCAxxG_C_C family probable redox protein
MNEIESVLSNFKEGFSCSQSIVVAYSAHFGLSREMALRISAGFGGGMGRMAGICGAVTGAFMVIGLKYGGVSADDKKAKERTYRHVRELANRFKALNGVITCKELLGCDISLPSGMEMAREKSFHTTVCPKFVRDAAEILEELIDWD